MTINVTIIIVTAGVMFLSMVLEKILSKGGNETGAYIVGIVSLIVGFLIIISLIKVFIDNVFETFFYFGM